MVGAQRLRPAIRRLALWVGPVLLLIAAWQVWDAIGANRIEREIARAFPEGLTAPVDGRDVRPGVDDAARYYAAAAIAVVSSEKRFFTSEVLWGNRDALSRGERPAANGSEAADERLVKNELSLRLVEEARTVPFGAFRPGTEFNYRFSGLLDLGHLEALRTLDVVRRGEADVAVDSLIARVQLLRAFNLDARIFATTYRASELQGIATDTALVLARTSPMAARLAELDRVLADARGDDEGLDRFIGHESAIWYEALQRIWGDRSSRFSTAWGFLSRPALRHHAVALMQVAADARRAAKRPWPDRLKAMNEIQERRTALPEMVSFLGSWRLVSVFREATEWLGVAVAAAQCARLAVALEQHRRQHGSFPERLDDLQWDAGDGGTLDPFTGQSLRYARTDEGYLLYSVGQNGRDDGGKVSPQPVNGRVPGTGPIPDVGVRVVRP